MNTDFFLALDEFMLKNGVKTRKQVTDFWDLHPTAINGLQKDPNYRVRSAPAHLLKHIQLINETTKANPFNPDLPFFPFNTWQVLTGKKNHPDTLELRKQLIELKKEFNRLEGKYSELNRLFEMIGKSNR